MHGVYARGELEPSDRLPSASSRRSSRQATGTARCSSPWRAVRQNEHGCRSDVFQACLHTMAIRCSGRILPVSSIPRCSSFTERVGRRSSVAAAIFAQHGDPRPPGYFPWRILPRASHSPSRPGSHWRHRSILPGWAPVVRHRSSICVAVMTGSRACSRDASAASAPRRSPRWESPLRGPPGDHDSIGDLQNLIDAIKALDRSILAMRNGW